MGRLEKMTKDNNTDTNRTLNIFGMSLDISNSTIEKLLKSAIVGLLTILIWLIRWILVRIFQ